MKKRKTAGLFRIIPLLLLCAVILGLVTLVIMPGKQIDIKTILRSIRRNQDGEFYYENVSGGVFSQVGNNLCLLSDNCLTVFDGSGEASISQFISYSVPELYSAGKYSIAYDLGGNDLLFFSSSSVITELETEAPIVSARVNEKGFIAVCTEESGWGGSVTVYNARGNAIYKWYSGSDRVLSACVRGKNDLLVLSLGANGSNLVRLSLDSEDEQARYIYDGLIYDIFFGSKGITAVTSSSILFFNDQLNETGKYDLSEMHLAFYDLRGAQPVLSVGESKFSSAHTVCVLSSSGEKLHELQTDTQIMDISVCKNYIAILYGDGNAVIYDKDMNIYASYEDVSGFNKIMLRADGTAIVANLYSARILSPKASE